jgi:hypothetical protein
VRAHKASLSDKSIRRKIFEIALVVIMAAAIPFVSVQMQSIIARSNSAGVDITTATVQLGISATWLIWERSALVLIFLSGWFREEQAKRNSVSAVSGETLSDETAQLILSCQTISF